MCHTCVKFYIILIWNIKVAIIKQFAFSELESELSEELSHELRPFNRIEDVSRNTTNDRTPTGSQFSIDNIEQL